MLAEELVRAAASRYLVDRRTALGSIDFGCAIPHGAQARRKHDREVAFPDEENEFCVLSGAVTWLHKPLVRSRPNPVDLPFISPSKRRRVACANGSSAEDLDRPKRWLLC